MQRAGSPHRPAPSHQAVVERAEAYMRAHLDDPIRLSRICRVVGRSERTLRNAFYGVRGMSPTHCLLGERLQAVRRALLDGGVVAGPCTVTTIAAQYGFCELGRFAGTYRQAFGEAPSETLRRRHERVSLPLAKVKGHVHVSTR